MRDQVVFDCGKAQAEGIDLPISMRLSDLPARRISKQFRLEPVS